MGMAAHIERTDLAVLRLLGDDDKVITYVSPHFQRSVPLRGLFDQAYQRTDVGTPGVVDCQPALFCRLSDLPGDPEEDEGARVQVGSDEYEVREPQKDGHGGVVLLLHKVHPAPGGV
jgi:hypothetical protein